MRHRLLAASLALAQPLALMAQQTTPPPSGALAPAGAAVTVSREQGPDAAVLPGTPRAAFGEIRGTAMTSRKQPLPARTIRLRDIRNGRTVESKLTDEHGAFTFRAVDPGTYLCELLADQGQDADKAVASSGLIPLDSGQAALIEITLPVEVKSLASVLGHHAAAAAIVAGSAAAAGVLAVGVKDCVSPPCNQP
jgi:hypothetical protein